MRVIRRRVPAPSSGVAQSSAAPTYLMQISRRAMATDFEIYLNAGQHGRATEAALRALDLVEQLEGQMTVYRPHSEVMDVNRRAADGPVAVEGRLFQILQLAVQLSQETGGAFDLTAGPLSRTWGFYRREGQLPDAEALQQALARVGYRWLELDDQRHTIRFLQRGVEINLNAVGKGYAVDRCGEVLREAGVEDFLIHGGQSSVLAGGSRAGEESDTRGWSVALQAPPQAHAAAGRDLAPRSGLGDFGLRRPVLSSPGPPVWARLGPAHRLAGGGRAVRDGAGAHRRLGGRGLDRLLCAGARRNRGVLPQPPRGGGDPGLPRTTQRQPRHPGLRASSRRLAAAGHSRRFRARKPVVPKVAPWAERKRFGKRGLARMCGE